MPKDLPIHADASVERLWTGATVITFIRTLASLALCLYGALRGREGAGWSSASPSTGSATSSTARGRAGSTARPASAPASTCSATGSTARRSTSAWPGSSREMALPVGVYLFEFMVIDVFLSLAFMAWPIRSPNYFYVVDRRIYLWNWSRPAKAANSALFAVLLLVTGWWWLGLVIALALLALKCVSLQVAARSSGCPCRTASRPRTVDDPAADHVRRERGVGAVAPDQHRALPRPA